MQGKDEEYEDVLQWSTRNFPKLLLHITGLDVLLFQIQTYCCKANQTAESQKPVPFISLNIHYIENRSKLSLHLV
jgi:hypothetical protein